MSEWLIVAGAITLFVTITGFIFGWGWKIIQDVKRSAHARIERVEKRFDEFKKDCSDKKEHFATNLEIDALSRRLTEQHGHLSNRVENMHTDLTRRIDNVLLAINGNGHSKRKRKD